MDLRKNFAVSTVATAPSPATSGTSLVVASGEGARFPAAPFNAVIAPSNAEPTPANSEIVRVTALSTDTFTITRAQESSSARTVVVGDRIFAGVTSKLITDLYATFRASIAWEPAGAIASTYPRTQRNDTVSVLQTGRLYLAGGCVAPANVPINTINVHSAATAIGTPTNWWFCLVDASLNVLRTTADQTTTAWGTQTLKSLALTSSYTPTTDLPVYVGIMCKATTMPSFYGSVISAAGTTMHFITPPLTGFSTSSLTTPASLGSTAGALVSGGDLVYAYLT